MGYPSRGFTYIQGPLELRLSTVSSTATFKAGNPVTFSDDRTVIEADSDTSVIFGIAQNDAGSSIGGTLAGKVLVGIPTASTIFAAKVNNGLAASLLSSGATLGLVKNGNYLEVGTSNGSETVVIVQRGDGSTVDSADSSVYVQFLGNVVGPFGSNAGTPIYAQN
jgi:hypothetical protein